MGFRDQLRNDLILQRSKIFDHQLINKIHLESETLEDGVRYYITPFGNRYKSVTTILSEKDKDKKELLEWKQRVGEAEANRIRRVAGTRGNNLHKLVEKYLMNDDGWAVGQNTINLENFKKIIPVLDQKIKRIYGCEIPLYSDVYKTAGTTDLCCQWENDCKSIVDFKSARSHKEKEDILNYFIQASIYSFMITEMYGVIIDQIVIILLIDNEKIPSVFIEHPANYEKYVNEIFLTN